MICPRCHESLASDATVCPSCGLIISSPMEQRCLVCGALLEPHATSCSHCGTPLSTQHATQNNHQPLAYQPPPDEELAGPPTIPYAQSRYARPPIMHAAPLDSPISANASALAPDETPTLLGMPTGGVDTAPSDGDATWSSVPPLTASAEPEDIPFAMTSAPVEPEQTATPETSDASDEPDTPDTPANPEAPAETDGDGLSSVETPDIERPAIHMPKAPLPDYDTPDIERPAIHVPKAPLPDYDTPDIEHTTVHAPRAPLPDYDTPDIEHTTVHPSPIGSPADGQLTPVNVPVALSTNGATPSFDTATTYPDAYMSPPAAHITGSASPSPASPLSSAPFTATSDKPVERIFGVQPPPKARTASNAIQGLWLRHLPHEWAVAPWISIPLGALLAVTAGLLVSIIGLLFWSRAVGYLLDSSNFASSNVRLIEAVLSPNLLQLFLLEHGVPMSLALDSPGSTGTFSAIETLPLTGLSLLPACALVLAGYVAAASDFSHRLRFSVLRGALVGPAYAILLLLAALFGSGTVRIAQDTVIQLHPSLGYAFLIGFVWGTLLGALGSLLAIRRHHLFTTFRRPDLLAGASWGALIALGSGLLLAAVALIAGMAAHVVGSVPSATAGSSGNGLLGALGAIATAISLLVVIAPVGALWVFALSTGATFDSWGNATGIPVGPGTSTFGLLAAQHHPSSVLWWLLLLIPLASYIIGGRAAARIARADSLRDSALVGWLMAAPLSLVMLILTLLSRLLISSEATVFERQVNTSLGIAPSAGAVFLLVLLIGGIVGALGGVSAFQVPDPGPLLASRASPLLLNLDPALNIALRPWDMFDAARNHHPPRTPLRALVYAAILAAAALAALFVFAVLLGWIVSHFAPVSAVRGFDGFFAGLAVGVPLLLLASGAILAMMRVLPPLLTTHEPNTPIMPRYPSA